MISVTAQLKHPVLANTIRALLIPDPCPQHVFLEVVHLRVATTRICLPIHEWMMQNLVFEEQNGYRFCEKTMDNFLSIARKVIDEPETQCILFPSDLPGPVVPVLKELVRQLEAAIPLFSEWTMYYNAFH